MSQANGQSQPPDELIRRLPSKGSTIVRESQRKDALDFFNAFSSEQAVVLRQPSHWSRAVVWTLIGVTTAGILWAAIASIEQVVMAKGQLKPQGAVKEIQAPLNGVVEKVMVKEGEKVKEGQVLVMLDSDATRADLKSQQKIKQSLAQESQFYRTLMGQALNPSEVEMAIARLNLPWEVAALARNRAALVAENQLYKTQLGSETAKNPMTPEQQLRIQAFRAELDSRAKTAALEVSQLQKQLNQTLVQLEDAKKQLNTDRQVLAQLQARNRQVDSEAQKSLAIEQQILSNVEPLLEEGALAKLQVERQRQSIIDRSQQIAEQQANGRVEYDRQFQQVQQRRAEIDRFQEEKLRLTLAIDQARAKLSNTLATTTKEIRDRISENQKRIAEIDSQLLKILVENEKRVAELEGQIGRSQVNLKYQAIKAPVNGTVFDLKAFPGYVPPPTQSEALLKIVPEDRLVAEVDVTNEDIGFVTQGQKADVRIDSFPFSEFGDIKGEVTSIGSDALPPDEIHRLYRFPVKVKLDQQYLKVKDREIPLQSGMSVSVNIKVREDRKVLSLFTELFSKKVETLKQVR